MARARVVIGLLGIIGFIALGGYASRTLSEALMSGADLSAVQVIQLYSETTFYGVVGLGVLLGAYVMTRVAP